MESTNLQAAKPLYKATQVVWFLFGVLELLLLTRFVLKLLGANPLAGFTDFIYSVSFPFVAPFQNVFGIFAAEDSLVEWSTLLAIIVYWVVANLITKLLLLGRPVTQNEAQYELRREDTD